MIRVPDRFAAGLREVAGAAAEPWLAGLPELAAEFGARWRLTPDGPLRHGLVALVLPVRRADGTPAVLKLTWRDTETAHEAWALRRWAGRGAARLLDHDDAAGALLLERLDPERALTDVPLAEALPVAGALLRRLAVPVPRDVPGLRRLDEIAARWLVELPVENAELGGPVPARVLAEALAVCRELGPTAGRWLVNEDLHYDNVLAGAREPWLAIDPKVLVGDVEFGLFALLWNRVADRPAPADRVGALVAAGELDPERARRWTLARAVDSWLWALAHGEPDAAATCAAVATALVRPL